MQEYYGLYKKGKENNITEGFLSTVPIINEAYIYFHYHTFSKQY
jgi:uncharacterized membrane protein YraQ (UPF0718 family)